MQDANTRGNREVGWECMEPFCITCSIFYILKNFSEKKILLIKKEKHRQWENICKLEIW